MGIFSLFQRKAAGSVAAARLPMPTTGPGRGSFRWTGTGFEFVEMLFAGGKQLAIQPKDAGNRRLNPVFAICLNWIGTSWPQAIPVVGKMVDADFVPSKTRHPVLDLLDRPNPDTSGKWLMTALQADYWDGGNAYAHIIPFGGSVAELNYIPSWAIKPVPDEAGYLSHYEHTVGGKKRRVEKEDIVHFKFGVNPDNPLLGRDPLESAFREIVKDNGASDYMAGLFKRGGVPPGILSPRPGKDSAGELIMDAKEAEAVTRQLQEKTEAEPGAVRFLGVGLDYHILAFKPGEMGVETCQEQPETRIPALFQIPPEVLKLRAGMLRSTYNNVHEATKAAWNGCLVPTQDYFAEELTNRLLPRYPNSKGLVIRYDRSNVAELQDDVNAKREQARADHEAGIITVEEARAEGGRQTTPAILATLAAEHTPVLALVNGTKSRPFLLRLKAAEGTDLYQALDNFRADLDNHETEAVNSMTDALHVAEESIRAKAEAFVVRMEQAVSAGQTISEAWLYQEHRYRELLDQVQAALRGLSGTQAGPLAAAQEAAVTAAADHAGLLARAALGPVPDGVTVAWNRLPVKTLESFVGFASDGSPLADLLDELGPDCSQQVREGILRGITESKGPRQIAGYIEDALGSNRNRALTIARSEVNRAARAATIQTYRENSDVVTGWIWLSALTTRTCAGCWAMHGSHHTSDETLDDHPSGRCVAAPEVRSLAEITGNADLPDNRPVIEDGPTQFAKLSAADQETIIGAEAFKLYRDGKIGLEHMVTQTHDERWGSMRRPATLAEAQAHAGIN